MSGLLKFITCGSVDDGKSTLIGHMLYDAKLLFSDQKQALELESKAGSRGGKIDYSLLLDGLMAEREQGITIDVAYRYFSTEKRSFIVADTPGHEEYTRNMAVGASFADMALILVDATKGLLIQTKRHARICSLMGIRYFLFAVNKMDLVHYDRDVYERIEKDIRKLAIDVGLDSIQVIPVSATAGDNITKLSENMPWFSGQTILSYLEDINIEEEQEEGFLLPIQRVSRPNRDFRGFQGEIACGNIKVEDEITVYPSREKATVSAILQADKTVDRAGKGRPVTLCLNREIDISRGCVIAKDTEPKVTSMFRATMLWMDDDALPVGKSYLCKIGTKQIPASVMSLKYKVDINSGEHLPVKALYKNEIAAGDIALSTDIALDSFARHRSVGSFILIDRVTHRTAACGVIEHSLRRSENVFWQKVDITREIRAEDLGQKPMTIWFTGLSGSGKSTLSNEMEKRLRIAGKHTMLLDGDNIRKGLNKNLGFEERDRMENIRRIAEVAKLMNDAGLIVLTSFISPYRNDREMAREIIGEDSFVEVYVSTSLEECEKRDVKGLYRKARNGDIPNFTGIGSAYEVPEHPQITVDTGETDIDTSVEYLMKELEKYLK